ncbi:hypothetical protein LguiB_005600 [Lonicera macranthoides]
MFSFVGTKPEFEKVETVVKMLNVTSESPFFLSTCFELLTKCMQSATKEEPSI